VICGGLQLQRNILGSGALDSAQISGRMVGDLKTTIDALAAASHPAADDNETSRWTRGTAADTGGANMRQITICRVSLS
jgi:hypothetical protein